MTATRAVGALLSLTLLAATLLAGACGSGPRQSELKQSLRDFDDRDDPALDARRKAIEAQLDARPPVTVVRRAEFRVEGLEATDTGSDRGPTFEVRVPVQHPWRLGAARSLHSADVQADIADLQQGGLEVEVLRCVQSVKHESYRLETESWVRHREDLDRLGQWLDELHAGQHISEPNYHSQRLALRTRAARGEPGPPPVAPDVLDAWALSPAPPGSTLDLDPGGLESLLLAHPVWDGYEAQEGRMAALSDEATARRVPWLQWISVSYEPTTDRRDARIEALLSFAVPLGIEESSRARAYAARADALRWKAKALFDQHRSRLASALRALQAYEARLPELASLMTYATEERDRARAWIENRTVPVRQAQSTLEDAHDLERSVLASQRDAALLRCETLALTGAHMDRWPRTTQ